MQLALFGYECGTCYETIEYGATDNLWHNWTFYVCVYPEGI